VRRWARGKALVACSIFKTGAKVTAEAAAGAGVEVSESISSDSHDIEDIQCREKIT
jgi:hypothetical protein